MAHDVVVVGGGLAGLTAGLYAARLGLRTVIVERLMAGGQVASVEKVETFPGFLEGISGAELGPTVQMQADAVGAEFAFDEVAAIERGDDGFVVKCGSTDYAARAVIVATGSSRKPIGVPGEEERRGRGVSECAACDGPMQIGKKVVVVGGGDSALDEACVLADLGVEEVLLVHRGSALDGQKLLQDRVAAKPNIRTLLNTRVREIRGEGRVTEVVLTSGSGDTSEPASGVFPYVGLRPNTEFLAGLVDLDHAGQIPTDISMMTSVPGLFAAGDIRQGSARQLVASAGDGATAAVAAARYLSSNGPG